MDSVQIGSHMYEVQVAKAIPKFLLLANNARIRFPGHSVVLNWLFKYFIGADISNLRTVFWNPGSTKGSTHH